MRRQIAAPNGVDRVVDDCHQQAAAASYYAYLRHGEMVVAHVADCAKHPRIEVLEVGFAEADHATAFGKLMLAFLEPDAREERLTRSPLQPITPATVTDPGILRRQLQQVRANGLAMEIDEFQPRLSCMAAPVTDAVGRFVGAVAISTSTDRLRSRRWDLEPIVRSAATRATRVYALARSVRSSGVGA
jgi:DNA-binding IclR family transcriptional regulator